MLSSERKNNAIRINIIRNPAPPKIILQELTPILGKHHQKLRRCKACELPITRGLETADTGTEWQPGAMFFAP